MACESKMQVKSRQGKVNPLSTGNIFLTKLYGKVDFASGNAFKLSDESLKVYLVKTSDSMNEAIFSDDANSGLLVATVDSEGNFNFDEAAVKNLDLANTLYSVIMPYQDRYLSALVNPKKEDVNISAISTLIQVLKFRSPEADSVLSSDKFAETEKILAGLENKSFSQALTEILTDNSKYTVFANNNFSDPNQLKYLQPIVLAKRLDGDGPVAEDGNVSFAVSTFHPDMKRVFYYVWKVNDTFQTTHGPSFTLQIPRDSARTMTVSMWVGEKGSNENTFASDTPVITKAWSLDINDTYPVVAPKVAFKKVDPDATDGYLTSRDAVLIISDTDNSLPCATGKKLAITESPVKPSVASYTYTCQLTTNTRSQELPYTLQGNTNGPIKAYLWSMDDSGKVSAYQEASAILDLSDLAPPTISLAGGAAYTSSLTVTATVSGIPADALKVYIAPNTNCLGGGTWYDLPLGSTPSITLSTANTTNTACAKYRASSNKISQIGTTTIIHDNTPPSLTASCASCNAITAANKAGITASGTCSENTRHVTLTNAAIGTVTTTCNGGTWTSLLNFSGLADGTDTLTVTHRDAALNVTTRTVSLRKSEITPTATITTIPATIGGTTTAGTQTAFSGTASTTSSHWSLDSVKYRITNSSGQCITANFASFGTCGSTWLTASGTASWNLSIPDTAFADGACYSLLVQAQDDFPTSSGTTSANFCWDGSTATPTVSLNSGATYTNSTILSVATSGVDADVADIYLTTTSGCASGGTWEAYATPKNFTVASGSGTKNVYVKVRDSLGNESSCATASIILDADAPSVTFTLPATIGPNSTAGANTSVSGTASDTGGSGLAQVAYQLRRDQDSNCYDGSSAFSASCSTWHAATGTSSWSITLPDSIFANGLSYTLTLRSTDSVGNNSTTVSQGFTWDSTPPADFSISVPVLGNNPTPSLSWASATDAVSYDVIISTANTCTPVIQSANGLTTTSYTPASSLADNTYYLCVTANDIVNNARQKVSSAFVIDTVGPATPTLSGTPTGGISGYTPPYSIATTLDVTVTGAADAVKYIYAIQETGAACSSATYSSPVNITTHITDTLGGDDTKRLCVKAVDAAGNPSSTAAEYLWVKASTPPTPPASLTLTANQWNIDISWPAVTAAWGYLVVARLDTAVSFTPSTATSYFDMQRDYTTSLSSGENFVVYYGTATSAKLRAIVGNRTYHVSVYTISPAWGYSSARSASVTSAPRAIIHNAPNRISSDTALNVSISGTGITQYMYAVQDNNFDCSTATYSSAISISTKITDTLSRGGLKALCVLGITSGGVTQTEPTIYTWKKTNDVGFTKPFFLQNPQRVQQGDAFTIHWTDFNPADDATATLSFYYDSAKGTGACSGNLIASGVTESSSPKRQAWSTSGLALGSYYLCMETSDGVSVWADVPVEVTDTCTSTMMSATPFAGGAGTSVSPYVICSATQLANIASYPNTVYFTIKRDLDLSAYSNWSPLACANSRNVAGNGYSIKNLSINRSTTAQQGLFANCGAYNTATLRISDLSLDNVNIVGANSVGAFSAGAVMACNNCGLYDASISGTSEVSGISGDNYSYVLSPIPFSTGLIMSNVSVTASSARASGVARYLANTSNAYLFNVNVTAPQMAAGLSATYYLPSAGNGTFTNIFYEGNLTAAAHGAGLLSSSGISNPSSIVLRNAAVIPTIASTSTTVDYTGGVVTALPGTAEMIQVWSGMKLNGNINGGNVGSFTGQHDKDLYCTMCDSVASITQTGTYTALTGYGYVRSFRIVNSVNKVSITTPSLSGPTVAGFMSAPNCYNWDIGRDFIQSKFAGTINATSSSASGFVSGFVTGGPCSLYIKESVASGSLTLNNAGIYSTVAGFVADFSAGNSYPSLRLLDSRVSTTISSANIMGGAVGTNYSMKALIARTYSNPTMSGPTTNYGGLIAQTYYATSVADVFVVGSLPSNSGAGYQGNIIGRTVGAGSTLANAYYSTNDGAHCVGAGTMASQTCSYLADPSVLTSAANPPLSNWDFSKIWREVSSNYPRLQWE